MRDERIEFDEERWRRCQQFLMQCYAEEPKYLREVGRLSRMLEHLADTRDQTTGVEKEAIYQEYRASLSRTVTESFRLVGREDGQPLAWAINWVHRDIRGEDASPPQVGPVHGAKGRASMVSRVKKPKIIESVVGPFPGFGVWVSPVAVGLYDVHGALFDDEEVAAPEPNHHYLFDEPINDETWETLKCLAYEAVDRGIRLTRAQFEDQIPTGRRVRPKTVKSDQIALQKLCRYLLKVEPVFDTPGPDGLRQVRGRAKLLGIKWPRLASKMR
jgi:hypothetical protein